MKLDAWHESRGLKLGVLALLALVRRWGAQSCYPDWTPALFTEGGIEGRVSAFIEFDDDGPGPNPPSLIVGGQFTEAGGHALKSIARWDGKGWTPLGSGINGSVSTLAVFDPDDAGPGLPRLYVGGAFWMAGDVPVQSLASWDGSNWSDVGGGITISTFFLPQVQELLVYDKDGAGPLLPALYVAGHFDTAGGMPASGLIRWDGSSWSIVGQPGTGGLPPGSYVQGARDVRRRRDCRDAAEARRRGVERGDRSQRRTGRDVGRRVLDFHRRSVRGNGQRPRDVRRGRLRSRRRDARRHWQLLDDRQPGHRERRGSDQRRLDSDRRDHRNDVQHFWRDLASFDEDGAGPTPPVLVVGGSFQAVGGRSRRTSRSGTGPRGPPSAARMGLRTQADLPRTSSL